MGVLDGGVDGSSGGGAEEGRLGSQKYDEGGLSSPE